jgi:hypothetical protein
MAYRELLRARSKHSQTKGARCLLHIFQLALSRWKVRV